MSNKYQAAIMKAYLYSHFYGESYAVLQEESLFDYDDYVAVPCTDLWNKYHSGYSLVSFFHPRECPCWDNYGISEDDLHEYLQKHQQYKIS